MRTLTSFLTAFAWSLWFGGLATLFVSVKALFNYDHALAVQAAPQLFHAFNRYQLVLAAVAVVSAVGWRWSGRSRSATVALALFVLSAAVAVYVPLRLVPPMDALQAEGRGRSPEFIRLHAESMILYTGELGLLAVAGVSTCAGLKRSKLR